jgi:hypothetical protein
MMGKRRDLKAISAAFSRFLSPSAIAELAENPEKLDLTRLTTKWLCCLLLQVRDDSPEDIQCNIAPIIPICLQNNGLIVDMMASIQLVAFGEIANIKCSIENSRQNCRNSVNEILKLLDKNIKIVAFEGNLAVGNIGAGQRFNYTVLVPKFDRLLAALLNTEHGHVTELPPL